MLSFGSQSLFTLVVLALCVVTTSAVPTRRHPRRAHARRSVDVSAVRDAVAEFYQTPESTDAVYGTTTAFYAFAQAEAVPTLSVADVKVLAVEAEDEQGYWQVITTSTWIGTSRREHSRNSPADAQLPEQSTLLPCRPT